MVRQRQGIGPRFDLSEPELDGRFFELVEAEFSFPGVVQRHQ
jgi:hypothetical protein